MLCTQWVCITAKKTQALDSPIFYKGDVCKPAQHLIWRDILSSLYWIANKSALCPRGRHYIFQGYLLYRYSRKDSMEQKPSVLLHIRCADMLETCEELFPNSITVKRVF